jgi:predicted dithiol-disulfide oxidoreductase (DUF899 family)
MSIPKIVSRTEWLAARKILMAKEKAATRASDALATERRALPMVEVRQNYRFTTPNGEVGLDELFGKQSQLLIYHFMFDPAWEEGCKSCSHLIDCVAGALAHLKARNTAFAVVSLAPIEKIEGFKARMGWRFPWVSSGGTDFNRDFAVTVDIEGGQAEYNYTSAADLVTAGKLWAPKGEYPGISAFLKHEGTIFHTYSAYQRGLDVLLATYNLLDMTVLGRQEAGVQIQSWIRHHDRYGR